MPSRDVSFKGFVRISERTYILAAKSTFDARVSVKQVIKLTFGRVP